jgi:polysaccharide export outer membrane protein
MHGSHCPEAPPVVPRELSMVNLPPYVVDSPDILIISALRLVPRGPYKIEPLDALLINVTGSLPRDPIAGVYTVDPDGTVNLGASYGSVSVAGLNLEDARQAIEKYLKPGILLDPKVTVGLAQSRATQQIRGEHMIGPDGTVRLGSYGSVKVAGLTLDQAKFAIEQHLSQYLVLPEVSVDVYAYNSKVYYVIFDGGGYGQDLIKLPITGNETVLDALSNSQVAGLPAFSSTKHIWIARPNPETGACDQILPVDWKAVTRGGVTNTNYQILPGDRVFVKADTMIAVDNFVAKAISPFERMFGFTLLGAQTIGTLHNPYGALTGGGGGGGAVTGGFVP